MPRLLIALFLLSLISCFGIDRRGGVVRWTGGEAITGGGRFVVGKLPPPWSRPRLRMKQLVFENDVIGGTIVTDALCGPKFNDAPLPRLAKDLFGRLDGAELERERPFTLDRRQAVRIEGSGRLDGVPIRMAVVVMKKDFCLYDFVYFAPPERFREGLNDFEGYLDGFRAR